VIKSLGYQIYPGDVGEHICTLHEQVANCVVVGVAHEVVSEAPVAVVEKKHGAELSCHDLDRHARSLPSYMRPRHWIILEPDQMPLNRVGKPDYLRVQKMAQQEIAHLRAPRRLGQCVCQERREASRSLGQVEHQSESR